MQDSALANPSLAKTRWPNRPSSDRCPKSDPLRSRRAGGFRTPDFTASRIPPRVRRGQESNLPTSATTAARRCPSAIWRNCRWKQVPISISERYFQIAWLIGVVFIYIGELFARENVVFLRQELIQRRTLCQPECPLASVGQREQGALVVNAAYHRLRFWYQ